MNGSELLREALAGLDLKYVDEAGGYRAARRVRRGGIIKTALIAAAVALLLCAGTAGVASALYGESMADFLSMLWERDKGKEMGEGQKEAIQTMTQEVGVSRSADGVTVNVTSARVSGYDLWLLLRAEGVDFKDGGNYSFEYSWVELTPEPVYDNVGTAGTRSEYQGRDGDGAGLFIVQYDTTALPEYGETLSVTLTLANLELRHDGGGEPVAAGPWEFEFELEFGPDDVCISLPDTVALGYSQQTGRYAEMALSNIELTGSGISYTCAGGRDYLELVGDFCAVLGDGSTVYAVIGGGGETSAGDWYTKLLWEYPIDVEDVAAVRIGDITVPVT